MNTTVRYRREFSAVHDLVVDGSMADYPSCYGRVHGHFWSVAITVGMGLDPKTGRIRVNLAPFDALIDEFEGESLNELLPALYPTPENFATYVAERLRMLTPGLSSVTVEMGDDVSASVSF